MASGQNNEALRLTWMETVVCWSWYVVNVWLFFVGTTVFRGISCAEANRS